MGSLIKWKEGQKIGEGSFGEVIRAMNCKDASIFAVKKLNFINPVTGVNQEVLQNLKVTILYEKYTYESINFYLLFQKEIEVLKKLDNQNIVKYIGAEIVN